MLAPFCLWLGLAAAAEGLNLGSRGPPHHHHHHHHLRPPPGQADPLEEAAFFDNGRWVKADDEKVRQGVNYTWKLNQGSMDDFNADQFCEDLPGDVLIVGDSISHQHYQTLVGQLATRSKHKRVSTSTPCWYPYADHHGGLVNQATLCWHSKNKRVVAHIRNDWSKVHDPNGTLEPNPNQCRTSQDYREADGEEYNATADQMEEATRPRNFAKLLPWDFPEILSRFKVFIFNSGCHYHPDADHRENVQGVLDLFQRHPEIDKRYVFWRTTMRGVGNCEAMNGKPPFPSLEAAEKHYDMNPWYEGADFKRQNDIATSMWAKHGFPLIDVYKSSMMNGHSGHLGGDCLHYQLGSGCVYEHWNRILYNMIRHRAGSHP